MRSKPSQCCIFLKLWMPASWAQSCSPAKNQMNNAWWTSNRKWFSWGLVVQAKLPSCLSAKLCSIGQRAAKKK